jgi:hypothetical protein
MVMSSLYQDKFKISSMLLYFPKHTMAREF